MTLAELWELFPVILLEHNPAYALWYEEERSNIIERLKEFSVCRVSHIGSTYVDGLIAKPTVDILLELKSGYDKEGVICALQEADWIVMARNDRAGTVDLNKGYTPKGFAEKVYHLHIKPSGDWDELYFRDYLQKYPDAAKEYERLKLNLKEKFERNRDAYTAAKSDFVKRYTQAARDEFGGRYRV
jgi:GrpB-like predicted nucleotidyltransferase (UPF0157 family)